jgi:hypothetical protein
MFNFFLSCEKIGRTLNQVPKLCKQVNPIMCECYSLINEGSMFVK